MCVRVPEAGPSSHKASQVEQEIRGGDRSLGGLLIGQETINNIYFLLSSPKTQAGSFIDF